MILIALFLKRSKRDQIVILLMNDCLKAYLFSAWECLESWPRNPVIAAVLHDLNLAEANGTGIRSMRRLAAEAGITLPEFQSDREGDNFCVTLFLHNLLTEDDHAWLRTLTNEPLDEEETKVLIYARATDAVDNTACRDFSGMDTLSASRVLRRLRDRGLLQKQGSGSSGNAVPTYSSGMVFIARC